MNGDQSAGISDIFLLDVIPLSVGIEDSNGLLQVLIKKNTTIPIKKNQLWQTSLDNQTQVAFPVYEGERPMAKDNHKIGEFIVDKVEPAPKGDMKFNVTFDISADGIMKVSAVDQKTGNQKQIIVKTRTLPQEDIERMIVEADSNRAKDSLMKTILDAQISFEHFCDVLKRRS